MRKYLTKNSLLSEDIDRGSLLLGCLSLSEQPFPTKVSTTGVIDLRWASVFKGRNTS